MSEIQIVHYIPGNKIVSYCFNCESEQELFLGFDLKYKGIFNLSLVQNHQEAIKSKSYFPFVYHVIRLSDMKLIGGQENNEGCFGVKNTYLLDNFNEDSASSKYIIRLKKKYSLNSNIQLFMIGYSMENIKFEMPNQDESNYLITQWMRSGKTS